jgi:hypothetical protein
VLFNDGELIRILVCHVFSFYDLRGKVLKYSKSPSYVITILFCLGFVLSATALDSDKPPITTKVPQIPPGTFPDQIGGPYSKALDGHMIEYSYSSGRKYRLKFYDDRVTFEQLNNPKAHKITLEYLCREIGEQQFLVHWLAPGYTGHVALIIDFKQNKIFGSALMPGNYQLFDVATIHSDLR